MLFANNRRSRIYFLLICSFFLALIFHWNVLAEDEDETEIIERRNQVQEVERNEERDRDLTFHILFNKEMDMYFVNCDGISNVIFGLKNNYQTLFALNDQQKKVLIKKYPDLNQADFHLHEMPDESDWMQKTNEICTQYFYDGNEAYALYISDGNNSVLLMNNAEEEQTVVEKLRRDRKKIDLILKIDHGNLVSCNYQTLKKALPKYMLIQKLEDENKGILTFAKNIGTDVYKTSSNELNLEFTNEDMTIQVKDKAISETTDDKKGWKTIFTENGYKYLYVNDQKESVVGWKYATDGKIFYFDRYGIAVTGDHSIEGVKYHFDENGELENVIDYLLTKINRGWYMIGNRFYYVGKDRQLVYGEKRIGQFSYYFNEEGILEPKWVEKNGTLYCRGIFGKYVTGWVHIGDDWYYALENGGYQTGWFDHENHTYYLDENGHMAKGLKTIDNTVYFFNSAGWKKDGWVHEGKDWYYIKPEGNYLTGWQLIDKAWYFFSENGKMATGWLHDGDQVYYLRGNGKMAKHWQKINDIWYCFDASGAMITDRWVGDSYLTSDGSMAVDTWIGEYHVNEDGILDMTRE